MNLQVVFTGFEQRLFLNGHPFLAAIYEGIGEVPHGFNAICLRLDASEKSSLHWKHQEVVAQQAVEKGLYLLWELDFNLPSGPLDDEVRFMSLQLNVQHFNTLIWSQFKDYSLGVALFRGEIHAGFLDYLKSLAASLSDSLSCFLFVEASNVHSLSEYFALIDQASLGCFHLFLKGAYAQQYPWSLPALGWGHGASPLGYCSLEVQKTLPQATIRTAICLPEKLDPYGLQQVVKNFGLGHFPFRVVPECLLTHEWDGIDEVIVFSNSISDSLKRKLCGFEAAGGRIIRFPDDVASLPPPEILHPSCPAV